MFKSVTSFALPYPGNSVARRDYNGDVRVIDVFFLKMVGYFIESIVNEIEPLRVNNQEVLTKDIKSYILVDQFESLVILLIFVISSPIHQNSPIILNCLIFRILSK